MSEIKCGCRHLYRPETEPLDSSTCLVGELVQALCDAVDLAEKRERNMADLYNTRFNPSVELVRLSALLAKARGGK